MRNSIVTSIGYIILDLVKQSKESKIQELPSTGIDSTKSRDSLLQVLIVSKYLRKLFTNNFNVTIFFFPLHS